MRSRFGAYVFGLGSVVAVAAPVFRDAGLEDSYPLSTYPMFARPISRPWVYFVEGVDAKNRVRRLTPEQVANDEPMQAYKTVRHAVVAGPEALTRLCRDIAARLAKDRRYAKKGRVDIVSARVDPLRYFDDPGSTEERTVRMSCKVPRRR